MKRAALLAVLVVGGCSQIADTSHDFYGNVYPADCPPSIVSDPALTSRVDIVREHLSGARGFTKAADKGRYIVGLSPALSGWLLADTKRHEFCHVKHWLAGNPDWHARYLPNIYKRPECANPFHC